MQRIALLRLDGNCLGALNVPEGLEHLACDALMGVVFDEYCRGQGLAVGHVSLNTILDDGSAGTFIFGPLMGAWEFLDHDQKAYDRPEAWVTDLLYNLGMKG